MDNKKSNSIEINRLNRPDQKLDSKPNFWEVGFFIIDKKIIIFYYFNGIVCKYMIKQNMVV